MMRSDRQAVLHYSLDLQAPLLDLLGDEGSVRLLARLRDENSALDALRLALAGVEERLQQPAE
jgi:hypothetical protein